MATLASLRVLGVVLLLTMGHVPSLVNAVDRCAQQRGGEFVCTHDVLSHQERLKGGSVDSGVTQRIDGSEEEKEAIIGVLNQMDDYFQGEVLAMPEYENIRHLW